MRRWVNNVDIVLDSWMKANMSSVIAANILVISAVSATHRTIDLSSVVAVDDRLSANTS